VFLTYAHYAPSPNPINPSESVFETVHPWLFAGQRGNYSKEKTTNEVKNTKFRPIVQIQTYLSNPRMWHCILGLDSESMIRMTALRARSEASHMALKPSFKFVHAVWADNDPRPSTGGAGDGSVGTGRADTVRNGASEWDNIVDGNTDRA
jgi:hypothetical protein